MLYDSGSVKWYDQAFNDEVLSTTAMMTPLDSQYAIRSKSKRNLTPRRGSRGGFRLLATNGRREGDTNHNGSLRMSDAYLDRRRGLVKDRLERQCVYVLLVARA